jgi:hypothetical protein
MKTPGKQGQTLAKALHLLDELCIAAEHNDRNHMDQAAGETRAFLDKLSTGHQKMFRDWHPNR